MSELLRSSSPHCIARNPAAYHGLRRSPSILSRRLDLGPRRSLTMAGCLLTELRHSKGEFRWRSDLLTVSRLGKAAPSRVGPPRAEPVRSEPVQTESHPSGQLVCKATGPNRFLNRTAVSRLMLIGLERAWLLVVVPGLDEPWDPGENRLCNC